MTSVKNAGGWGEASIPGARIGRNGGSRDRDIVVGRATRNPALRPAGRGRGAAYSGPGSVDIVPASVDNSPMSVAPRQMSVDNSPMSVAHGRMSVDNSP